MATLFSHGYALLIGVGQSAYAPWSLPATVQDAQALRAILVDPERCAYPDTTGHIQFLHDAGATRAAILEHLAWLTTCITSDTAATAVVYYSGHGWLDSHGTYYLIPHDVDPLDIPGSALSANDFTETLRTVDARRLLVILDCCHAAGMATAKEPGPALKLPPDLSAAAAPKALITDLKRGAGRAVFTSSLGNQRSWMRPDGALSVYTHHLLEALAGAANRPGDTEVRLSHLMNHLGQAVPASARAMGQEQTPFFDTATEDFPVALLLGGKGLAASPPMPSSPTATTHQPTPQTINNQASNQGAQGVFHGPVTFNVSNTAVPQARISEPASASTQQVTITQQQTLLSAERERLSDLLLQQAKLGSAWAPPGITGSIREARHAISRIKQALNTMGVHVENLPDDD